MKIPARQQVTSADCGATCLGMVLAAHGQHVPAGELRDAMGGGSRGVSAERLAIVARQFGLVARGARVEAHGVQHLPGGSILHWQGRHFVVFDRRTRGGQLAVVDPAQGRQVLSPEAFWEHFTGLALILAPGADFQMREQAASRWWYYLGLLVPMWPAVVGLIALSAGAQALLLCGPMLTRYAIDTWLPQTQDSVAVLAMGVVVLAVSLLVTEIIRALWSIGFRRRLDQAMTGDLFRHLLSLPLRFFLQRSTGDLLDRLRGHRTLRDILTHVAVAAALDLVLVLGAVGLLASLSIHLTLVALLVAVANVAVLLMTNGTREERTRTEIQSKASTQALEVEALRGIENIKALGAEEDMEARWLQLYGHQLNMTVSREQIEAWIQVLGRMVSFIGPIAVLLVGLEAVRDGSLSLGTVMAIWALVGSLLGPIQNLAMLATRLYTMQALLERADDILMTAHEPGDRSRPLPTDAPLVLESVRYRHGAAGPWVLQDVSFTIMPGEHVAIVGGSGSGKSTLVRMLSGLIRPASGELRVGGEPLWHGDVHGYRQRLGVVTQAPAMVAGTIADNLRLGNGGCSDEALREAATQAEIHDDIVAMPLGYDTRIGDGGCTLSGGQRQRLAIARALLRRPEILLLDEATSALDTVTERAIQEAIDRTQCTRVVVAHRLSTIQDADRILVMAGGRLVETGTHQSLMAANSRYAALVHAQRTDDWRVADDQSWPDSPGVPAGDAQERYRFISAQSHAPQSG